jgi:hypothetical protein
LCPPGASRSRHAYPRADRDTPRNAGKASPPAVSTVRRFLTAVIPDASFDSLD